MADKKLGRILWWTGLAAVLAFACLWGLLSYLAPKVTGLLSGQLAEQTGRPVRIKALAWHPLRGLSFSGRGIEIGAPEGSGDPPFLSAESLRVETSIAGLIGYPKKIELVRLRGLRMHILPRRRSPAGVATGSGAGSGRARVAIRELVLEDAELEIASSQPGKTPRRLRIHELRLSSLQLDRAIPFKARLTYPRPRGELQVDGVFGPWNPDDPVKTPISGRYDFHDADLGTFKRIQGLLSATGTFEGTVERTSIRGRAEVPDFAVMTTGHVVPLHTEFRAELKAAGANLELQEVKAWFLESVLVGKGSIVKDGAGRSVALGVKGVQTRIEDLLKFALKSPAPPLLGEVHLETEVAIPSDRERTLIDKIRIRGTFSVVNGQFTSVDLQKTLGRLSRLGKKESGAEQGTTTLSHMSGDFTLEDGDVEFGRLAFGVPGFDLDLKGRYVIADETMDFAGQVLMARSPSQMLPESWSRWTRIIDPVFRSDRAGTTLPIRITGTRSRPSIRLY